MASGSMTLSKEILIICCLDEFANGVRTNEIKKFLEKAGCHVTLLNTFQQTNSNAFQAESLVRALLPKTLRNRRFIVNLKKREGNRRFIADLKQRAKKIEPHILAANPDVLICESMADAYVMTKDFPCLKILDCPTPWVDEFFYAGKLTRNGYSQLRSMEIEEYKKSDYVAFHWDSYAQYVRQHIYNGKNFFILNWGCTPKKKRARYQNPPRIVFMGLLKEYWSNLPLLARLSKKYPIDVYGGPPPPKEFGLRYRGFAPSTEILSEYQFGLITISDDPLRRQGFSAKHLEYMNYGLPVLTPQWRTTPTLNHVSIYYDENNFLEKLQEFSRKDRWQQISDICYRQAQEWRWSENLKPLLKIIGAQKE